MIFDRVHWRVVQPACFGDSGVVPNSACSSILLSPRRSSRRSGLSRS